MTIFRATPLPRIMAVAVMVAAMAIGGNAFGFAVASAEPDSSSWDIEAYDDCMSKTVRNADLCCIESGGTPSSDPSDTQADGSPNCYAPPAEASSAEGTGPIPPRTRPEIVGDTGAPPQVAGDPGLPPRPRPDVSAPTLTLAPSG